MNSIGLMTLQMLAIIECIGTSSANGRKLLILSQYSMTTGTGLVRKYSHLVAANYTEAAVKFTLGPVVLSLFCLLHELLYYQNCRSYR